MTKLIKGCALILLCSLLFGCSDTTEESNVNFNIIASEKTLPSNFEEIAFQGTTPPLSRYLVKTDEDPTQYEENWRLYGLSQPIVDVDFNENTVLFFGIIESGSCPNEIKQLNLDSEKNTLTVPISGTGGACTADATPRTIVIQLEKAMSEQINEIVMLQYNTETNIPIELTK